MALEKTPICNFGEKAKDFYLKSIDENKYSLKDIVGENGTLIMFICNHCPYVRAISKEISKLLAEESFLDSILLEGSEKANKIASKKIKKIHEIVGF